MPALPSSRRRLADRLARRLGDPGLTDADAIHLELLEGLGSELGLASACWHLADPATGSPRSLAAAGSPPGSFEESLRFEFGRADVGRFAELVRRPVAVTSIGAETGGRPERSARFREMIAPAGAADELRVAIADRFGIWSAVVLFGDRRLGADDLELVAVLVPAAAAALRRSVAAGRSAARPANVDRGGPGVALLDAEDRIASADLVARSRLAGLAAAGGGGGAVPGVVSFLAAAARAGAAPGPARAQGADGSWLRLDASLLDGGAVAVVLQLAAPPEVLEVLLRAHGLSARERDVALLAVEGRPTKLIAQELALSRHTVADHLKAVFDKTGVGGRSELLELLPAGVRAR